MMIWGFLGIAAIVAFRMLAAEVFHPKNVIGELLCWALGVAGTFILWLALAFLGSDGPEIR